MPSITKVVGSEFDVLEKQLAIQRDKLRRRFAEQRVNVFVDREPDDEGAEATRNLSTHLLLSTLDRDGRILTEIELALDRMRAGEYGVCEGCDAPIPPARLAALPWARLCVRCAERASQPSRAD